MFAYATAADSLVFSAHAEVVPDVYIIHSTPSGILRARGGSSGCVYYSLHTQRYSPRTRR